MTLDFFNQMLSIPPEKPLTATQRFTFLSALIGYLGGGLSVILAPDLWNTIFGLDFSAGGRGYFILVGGGLVIIGFCLIVNSRGTPSQVPGHGAILATVFGRVVLVNWKLYSLYNKGLLTLRLVFAFSGLDSGLALITYAIWSREIEGASLKRFFEEIWAVVNPCPTPQRKPIYVIFQAIGYLQFVIGTAVAPKFLQSSGIVPMETFGTHAEGLLLIFLTMFSIHGWFHALAGGAGIHPFLIGAIFYRVAWNIPFFLFAGFTSKIEIGLAAVLVSFDAVYLVIVSILLFTGEARVKKN